MKRKQPSPERLEILEKIRELEAAGGESFYTDVEPDPPGRPLTPEEVDYLQVRLSSKWHAFWARRLAALAQLHYRRALHMRVVGAENLAGVRGGAILTSNHFSKYENLAVKEVADRVPGRHRFYRVVKGSNFFLPGIIGYLMRHCDTLPLSSNIKTTRLFSEALAEILRRGDLVLIYPEQAMWWNYRKPRPFRPGAFFYAAKCGVPVIPVFVTMQDQDRPDEYGFPRQSYTIHVMPPIYPDPNASLRENEHRMLSENQRLCNNKYLEIYGLPPENGLPMEKTLEGPA